MNLPAAGRFATTWSPVRVAFQPGFCFRFVARQLEGKSVPKDPDNGWSCLAHAAIGKDVGIGHCRARLIRFLAVERLGKDILVAKNEVKTSVRIGARDPDCVITSRAVLAGGLALIILELRRGMVRQFLPGLELVRRNCCARLRATNDRANSASTLIEPALAVIGNSAMAGQLDRLIS